MANRPSKASCSACAAVGRDTPITAARLPRGGITCVMSCPMPAMAMPACWMLSRVKGAVWAKLVNHPIACCASAPLW
jgi:hypothetical protein